MDVPTVRAGEPRTLSIAYSLGVLAVLALTHTERGRTIRIISFRRASKTEREAYHAWLQTLEP